MGQNSLKINNIIYSYVLIIPAPTTNVQFELANLPNLFGEFGQGEIQHDDNRMVVGLKGSVNKFEFSPPRIIFQADSLEVLYEVYKNAFQEVLPQFAAQPAEAFGVNLLFEVDVMDESEKIMNKLFKSDYSEQFLVIGTTFKFGDNNITLESIEEQDNILIARINNHIEKPEISFYSPEELKINLEKIVEENEHFLGEMIKWTRAS